MSENQDGPPEVITRERQSEEPLSIIIPVEIKGIDGAGHLFTERTKAEEVTEIGCRFAARTELQCGDIVAVKPIERGKKCLRHEQPQMFEVTWTVQLAAG